MTKNGSAFATGTGPSFTFTPNDMGSFVASLVATDKKTCRACPRRRRSRRPMSPPGGDLGDAGESPAGKAITLVGSATDPAAAVATAGYTYAWSVTKNGSAFATGTGPSFTFTPDDMGSFVASLVATDKNNVSSVPATATVAATDVAPTVQAGGPYSVTAGSSLSFQGSATDPIAAIAAAGFTDTWNFGDGSQGNGLNPSHTYTVPGTYNVGLTVVDKNGGISTATAVVTVSAASASANGSLLFDFGW